MSPEQLFTAALGLASPWHVARLDFTPAEHALHLYLDFDKGARFPCPTCGQPCGVYDSEERSWQHLNFFEYHAYLHARFPRIQCPQDGIHTITAPWARPGSGFTLLFEAWALMLCQKMSVLAVANLMGVPDKRIWTIIDHHVTQARQEQDLSSVEEVGIDEVARRRGQEYVTLCTDQAKGCVIAVAAGHGEQSIAQIRDQLEKRGASANQIKTVSRDLSPAFTSAIRRYFPKARQVADPFHIAQMVHRALDQTRRQEVKTEPRLKGGRYLWLKHRSKLTAKEQERLQTLEALPLQTVCAYRFKEEFGQLWQQVDADAARQFLQEWNGRVQQSDAGTVFKTMASNLMAHTEQIVNYHATGGKITNGVCEAINGLVDMLKARARGYANTQCLTNMIFLTQGKLAFELPTLNNE